MSDADKSLEVLLKTKADLKDAKALQAELERSILRAKLLGKGFSDLQAQLDRVKGAVENFEKANGKSLEDFKLFEGHAREVKKSIRELGEQFPIAAQALKLLTNPVGGALALAIGMFTWAKEKLDEWNKSLDEQAEILRKADFADAMKARKDALEQGEIAAAMYRDKMEHLIDPEERYQKAVQASIALIQERSNAAQQISDANHGVGEEQIKHQHEVEAAALQRRLEMGQINQEQYEAMKANLDEQYFQKLSEMEIQHEQERIAREKATRQELLDEEIKALQHRADLQPEYEQKASEAAEKAKKSAAEVAKVEGNVTEGKSHKDEDAKAVEAAKKKIKDLWGNYFSDGMKEVQEDAKAPGVFGDAAREALGAYNDAVNLQQQHFQLAGRETQLPGLRTQAALDQAHAQFWQQKAEENKIAVSEKQDELMAKRDQNAVKDAAADAVGKAKADQAGVKTQEDLDKINLGGGYTGADVENMNKLEQRRYASVSDPAHFKPLTDAENRTLDAFKTYVSSRSVWNQNFEQLMILSVGTSRGAIEKLESFEKELQILNSRIKGSYNK